MKNLLVVMLFLPIVAFAQEGKSCCTVSATAQFAMLAKNESFKASHVEPVPFKFTVEKGKFVTFKTSDGIDGRAFEAKAAKATNNYIFMIHEWWGLNGYIQQEAERLQRELRDVNVLALDLYDGKVATTREDASKYVGAMKEERARVIIRGALDYAGSEAKIGTIGWCFGGGWSLQSALMAGKKCVACVIYYGMPERDPEKLKALNAPVLGIFGKKDKGINPEVVRTFEIVMKNVQKDVTVKMYDAVHAFANPSNPQYDKEATADAHKHTIEFFKKNLVK